MKGHPAAYYFLAEEKIMISIITEMELLGKYQIDPVEKHSISNLIESFYILNIKSSIKDQAIEIMQSARIKLPDAIIAATAMQYKFTLVTADNDFKAIPGLDLLLLNV
jgi:predicted nucleic acid-binding protein